MAPQQGRLSFFNLFRAVIALQCSLPGLGEFQVIRTTTSHSGVLVRRLELHVLRSDIYFLCTQVSVIISNTRPKWYLELSKTIYWSTATTKSSIIISKHLAMLHSTICQVQGFNSSNTRHARLGASRVDCGSYNLQTGDRFHLIYST